MRQFIESDMLITVVVKEQIRKLGEVSRVVKSVRYQDISEGSQKWLR